MFVTWKHKSEALLSSDPETKHIRHWKRMQTGFNAAKLKIQCNHRERKKRVLDALYATEKYHSMNSVEIEQADMKVTMDCEMRRDADLMAAAEQWKSLNRISDDETNDKSNDESDNENNNKRNNKSTNNANELDWQWPDHHKHEISDPEYEVNEITATQEEVPNELDKEGEVKLEEEATTGLRRILERAYKRYALFIKHVVDLAEQHSESEINWDSKHSKDSAEEENEEDDEDEWKEIKHMMCKI